ncbi:hypothetical protein [Pseudomonas sp. SM4]|uniref:hypothetical protein n=1 Tax=Pseudomonas sp. SM4 TaxID=3424177 RepID=UPI003F78CD43
MGNRSRLSVHSLARRCFWLLPATLRNRLHGVRHAIVRWLRSRSVRIEIKQGDMTAARFSDEVLNAADHRLVVILEANVDWGITLFQRPHHMALALGRQDCLVIFQTTGDDLLGFRQVAENVWIANDSIVDEIPNAVRCFYSTSLLATREAMSAARRRGRVVYEYIDHIDASISGGKGAIRRLLDLKAAAFEGVADVIVSSAAALQKEALAECGQARCVCVPNGVDVAHYRGAGDSPVVVPASLVEFKGRYKQVVGYFGAIAPWLWYEVIEQVCAKMPDVGFVFIGPDYSGCVPLLPKLENVLYLGPVKYADLPAHARFFDACFIPFKPGDVARSTSPLKLYEYFALEKPVVVTADMNECTSYPEVFSGSDAAGLITSIRQALTVCDDEAYRARLRDLADQNSWNVRASAYVEKIESLEANN